MDKLYPIIRRKRRPLVADGPSADVPPILTKTEPVQSVAGKPLIEPAEISKSDDASIPSTTETP
jgi:hypothetical protein